MSREEDFLSRWSRRKRSGPDPDEETPPAPELAEPAGPPPEIADEDEAATLARLGLPDPDTLEKGADFSVFMQTAVPEAIRKRALRRLWRSNPTLAVLDGLNDYDDDFSGGFVAPGTLKTAYEVGRGIVNRALEEKTPAGEGDAVAEVGEISEPAARSSSLRAPVEPRPPAPEPEPEMAEEEEAPEALAEAEPEQEETPGPARRRMAFRFEDSG